MYTIPSIHAPPIESTRCDFSFGYTGETPPKINRADIFLNIPVSTDAIPQRFQHLTEYERGWIAVRHTLDRNWFTADAIAAINTRSKRVGITCLAKETCDAMALGIDQRLKREDVDGATIIYEENDKWLFAHATVEDHHNRILAAEAASVLSLTSW